MFTLSGEVFSVNKTSQFAPRLVRHLKAALSSEQSRSLCRYHREALTSADQVRVCIFIEIGYRYTVPGRGNGEFCETAAPSQSVAFYSPVVWWRPLSTSNPARCPMYRNCLNTSCRTEGTSGLGGWRRRATARRGKARRRDGSCGWEWVGLI